MINPKIVRGGYSFQSLPVADAETLERAAEKTVLIFGGTKGIGRGIAEAFDKFGAKRIVVFGRTFENPNTESKIEFVPVDLSLMQNCQKLVDEQEALLGEADEVIFTNGIISANKREETKEKLEVDMAVSYLSRLVVLNKLINLLHEKKAKDNLRCWVMGFPGVSKNTDTNLLEDLNAEMKYEQFSHHLKTVVGNECMVHYYKDTPLFGKGLLHSIFEFFIGACYISAESYGSKVARMIISQDLEAKTCSGMLLNQNLQEVERGGACTDENVKAFIVQSFDLINKAMLEVPEPTLSVSEPTSPMNMK